MASGDNQDVEEVAKRMEKVSVKEVIDDNGVKVKGEVLIEEGVKDGALHLNVNEKELESGKNGDRHCAFCLDLVPKDKVMLCGKCNKRAYCSKQCQKADWKTSKDAPVFNGKIYGYGQGHKNWCGLEYGEEDLDWKVVPIEGKGLGIVALRDLPRRYMIIVDGTQRYPQRPLCHVHPAFHDLTGGASDDPLDVKKWLENSIASPHSKGERFLPLRIARANHSCDPNACSYTFEEYNVVILASDKEIKAGEEICKAYFQMWDLSLYETIKDSRTPPLMLARTFLENNHGIICPPSCICRGEKAVIYSSLVHTCLKLKKEGEVRYKRSPKKDAQPFQRWRLLSRFIKALGLPSPQ